MSLLLDRLADGETETQLLADYPQLVPGDIRAAIAYGAEMSRQRIIPAETKAAA